MAESERIAQLEHALEEQKQKSQSDQRRLVKRLKEINDSETQKLVQDYEKRLSQQAEEHERTITSHRAEMDRSSERLTIMTNMVDKLKQARLDLLDKLEKKDTEFASKEEALSDEISNLKSEISLLKMSNAEDSRSLQEISAGYVLEISQLQDQLAAAQAALKILQADNGHSDQKPGGDAANESDQLRELQRLNGDLQAKLFEITSSHETLLQESAHFKAELQQKTLSEAQLQYRMEEAMRGSEDLQVKIQEINQELAEFRDNRSKDISTINDLEQEIQRLISQNDRLEYPPSMRMPDSPAMQVITSLVQSKTMPKVNSPQTEPKDDRIISYELRIQELEAQLKQLENDILAQVKKSSIGSQVALNIDAPTPDPCGNCHILMKTFSKLQLRFSEQMTPLPARASSSILESPNAFVEGLGQILDTALEQLEGLDEIKVFFESGADFLPDTNHQIKYHILAQSELRWHEISNHQQNVIDSLIHANSHSFHITKELESLRQTNERFKEIVKEQREQHKLQIKNANDKISLAETSLSEQKKTVKQLLSALKKLKESPTNNESQTLKRDLDAALSRAESAENQVAHLQKSLEMIELAQNESVHERKLNLSKIEELASSLGSEKNRAETLDSEKQQISSQLVCANNTIAELKEAEHALSEQVSRLQAMISAHWVLDPSNLISPDSVPEFEIRDRCQIDSVWWLFIYAKWESGDNIDSKVFWSTTEAFDIYSGQKITTGLVADTELAEKRSACVLSSGVALPESIESRAEASLKAKFDRKWTSATKKFDRKIAELNQKLQSSQSVIDKISSEFEEYKKQASIALESSSGGALRVAEMLDRIDQLEQERSLLQSSLRDANQRSVDETDAEIQRLLGVIESARASFHQSEVKWSHELQALQVENERLLNRNQQEESASIASLTERLEILQDELQRHRSSATEIIKERDQTISSLHKQFMSAQESIQELQCQIRILQAELVSLKQDASFQAPQAMVPARLDTMTSHIEPVIISPEHRRSRTDSTDHSAQIQKLQSLLRDAELQREHQSAQMRQLQAQVRELSRSNERSGANLDYLKHIIVKYMETDERLTLLPVIANILAFDPEETERIRAKIEKSNSTGLIPKIW